MQVSQGTVELAAYWVCCLFYTPEAQSPGDLEFKSLDADNPSSSSHCPLEKFFYVLSSLFTTYTATLLVCRNINPKWIHLSWKGKTASLCQPWLGSNGRTFFAFQLDCMYLYMTIHDIFILFAIHVLFSERRLASMMLTASFLVFDCVYLFLILPSPWPAIREPFLKVVCVSFLSRLSLQSLLVLMRKVPIPGIGKS